MSHLRPRVFEREHRYVIFLPELLRDLLCAQGPGVGDNDHSLTLFAEVGRLLLALFQEPLAKICFIPEIVDRVLKPDFALLEKTAAPTLEIEIGEETT